MTDHRLTGYEDPEGNRYTFTYAAQSRLKSAQNPAGGLVTVHDEGSHECTFEAHSHSFSTRCLRFAGRVTPTPRKTRFRLLVKLYRTGSVTRKVPLKGF